MGLSKSLLPACRKILCQTAQSQTTITFKALAIALGQHCANQQWSILLNPIADQEVTNTGHDLTLVVVYSSGPLRGLGAYHSSIKSGQSPQTTKLDPSDPAQIAQYKSDLAAVWAKYKYAKC